MSNFDEVIVFGKKSLSDLFRDVYDTTKKKDKEIADIIGTIKDLIVNAADAIMLTPLLVKCFEVSVTNNDHIIKMLSIVQKATARAASEGTEEAPLTKEEREDLLKQWGAVVKDIKTGTDV